MTEPMTRQIDEAVPSGTGHFNVPKLQAVTCMVLSAVVSVALILWAISLF